MSLNFKRNFYLIVILAVVLVVLLGSLGDTRVIAYTTVGTSSASSDESDTTGGTGLFDDTVVHSIQLIISDDDYEKMISTYQETGEKDYFHADIVIDGVRVNDVGVRLKGNASLRTAVGSSGKGGEMGNGGFGGGRGAPGGGMGAPGGGMPAGNGGQLPQAPGARNQRQPAVQSTPTTEAATSIEPTASPTVTPTAQVQGPANAADGVSTVKIPLKIKFDEFIEGQTYQGYSTLVIRTYGTNRDASILQEPVTNAMATLVGLPATKTAYTGFKLNDDPEQLYTISEDVNESYLEEHFSYADGVLYKAELGANLTYVDDDPSSYATRFTQKTRVNDADLAPLIDFMKFLTQSDDATFDGELEKRLDVDALATYLAVNNLLVNTDSLAGMSNNYYLYYDDQADRFTLLMWDANESLGKLGNSQSTTYDIYYQNQNAGGGGRGGGGPMGGGASNLLVKRFLASDKYTALYEQKLKSVYEQVFTSGAAATKIEQYTGLVRQANQERSLVDADSYDSAVSSVLSFIDQRADYLAGTSLLSGQSQ